MFTYLIMSTIIAIVYTIVLVIVSDKYLKGGGYYTKSDEYNSDKIAGAVGIGVVVAFGWFITLPLLAIIALGLILKKKYSKYVLEWYENTFVEDK